MIENLTERLKKAADKGWMNGITTGRGKLFDGCLDCIVEEVEHEVRNILYNIQLQHQIELLEAGKKVS